MEVIKVFKLVETLNNKVNIEKLSFELKTSTISEPATAVLFGSEVQVRFATDALSIEDQTVLIQLIGNHDGQEPDVTQDKVDTREFGIRTLVQMAIYHPILDNDETNEYLTYIDNYINAFIRSGNYNNLVAKIGSDAADTEGTYHTYLNQIVNTSGNKTFEYFISSIMNI